MKTLHIRVDKDLYRYAQNFQEFRNRCKQYLENHGILRDKFTTTDYDALLGYLSEYYIANYLRDRFKGQISVSTWKDQFDISHIKSIVNCDSGLPEDINLVCSYFYDSFDLYIATPTTSFFVNLKVDVKTAITEKEPKPNWEFLYPVVQANKEGKDLALLVYYVAENDDDPKTLKGITIIGYLEESEITRCETIQKGEKTRHGTLSLTENYITYLRDYKDIEVFLESKIKKI